LNTIAFYTLGCKANQAETAAMEQLAAEAGCTAVPFGSPADITIINSCTVTQTADKKSRQALRRARAVSPEGIIAVCGCYAQREAEALVADGLADIATATATTPPSLRRQSPPLPPVSAAHITRRRPSSPPCPPPCLRAAPGPF